MDEKPDQIIGHIEAQRDMLGRNLNELETRVRASTDWRTYYDRNPMLIVGAALGGGILLGSIIGAKSNEGGYAGTSVKRRKDTSSPAALGLSSAGVASSIKTPRAHSEQWHHVSQTMEHVKAALVAFGVAKAKEFLSQAIPGIDQHLQEVEQKVPGRSGQPQSGAAQDAGNWESEMYRSSGSYNPAGETRKPEPVSAL